MKKNKSNFKHVFREYNYNYSSYSGCGDIDDINITLSTQPEKHTFIFIMEMLRCSKTIKKQYLGVVYERFTPEPDDAVIIQGLLGRCTGYDDNKQTIIFTNIDSIIKYYRLWESGFDDRTIKWNSKTTTYRRGELRGNKTFNDPELYQGFDVQPSVFEPQIKKFNTAQEAINFYKTDLKTIFRGLGPRGKYEMTEDGFFLEGIVII